MNKKLSALNIGLAVSTVLCLSDSVSARVTGFYVGVSVSANLGRFKIYNGSKHVPGTINVAVPAGAVYDGTDNAAISSDAATTATFTPKSVLAGNDDFAATQYINSVRPSANLFFGYNYQVASNFVVGGELSFGVVFGAHKYSGTALVPDLTEYSVDTANGAMTEKKTGYYAGKSFPSVFELRTKFTADAALRIGTVIPGTDGRLALYLKGMVGLARQELKFSQTGAGAFYYQGILDSAIKASKSELYKLGPVIAGSDAATKNRYVAMAYARDLFYNTYKLKGIVAGDNVPIVTSPQLIALRNGAAGGAGLDAATVGPIAEAYAAAIVKWSETGSDLITSALTIFPDPSISTIKNRFRCGVGADVEYSFASGGFVRFSYMFVYTKGFFAESTSDVKSVTKQNLLDNIGKQFDDGVFNGYIDFSPVYVSDVPVYASLYVEAVGGVAVPAGLTPAQADAARAAIAARVKTMLLNSFDSIPAAGVQMGKFDHKVGTGKKSFGHEFSVGVGWRF